MAGAVSAAGAATAAIGAAAVSAAEAVSAAGAAATAAALAAAGSAAAAPSSFLIEVSASSSAPMKLSNWRPVTSSVATAVPRPSSVVDCRSICARAVSTWAAAPAISSCTVVTCVATASRFWLTTPRFWSTRAQVGLEDGQPLRLDEVQRAAVDERQHEQCRQHAQHRAADGGKEHRQRVMAGCLIFQLGRFRFALGGFHLQRFILHAHKTPSDWYDRQNRIRRSCDGLRNPERKALRESNGSGILRQANPLPIGPHLCDVWAAFILKG